MTQTTLIDRADETKSRSLVPTSKKAAIVNLDKTVTKATEELTAADTDIQRAIATSYGLNAILEAMTDEILIDLGKLQGTKLGFRTDRDTRDGYTPDQLKPVIAEALLRGLQVVGNHINVIAGNLYVTKEGFEHLLSKLPGLTDLKIQVGVPTNSNGGALVPARASWKMHGVKDDIVCEGDYRIPIRVNSSMGVDAILGKAKSKILRMVHSRVTGSELSCDADEVVESVALQAESVVD